MRPCGFILFAYELFISKSKSKVYEILHDVSFFFFKTAIKGHSYCLSTVYSMHIVRFAH